LLGLQPVLGRTFTPDEDQPGAEPVAVVGAGLWQRRFGGSTALPGQTIVLNDVPHTVVGVVPGDFQYQTAGAEVWVPLVLTPEELELRDRHYLNVVAQLRDGVSIDQARANLDIIARNVERVYAGRALTGASVVSLRDEIAGSVRSTLWLLLGTVGVVLLIACVNVAHLLLARGTSRRREIAVRTALGAGRRRVLRQLITESLLLASAGALAGSALSTVAFEFLARLLPSSLPQGSGLGLDLPVLAFAACTALVASIVFGVAPWLVISRANPVESLRGAGARGTVGHGWRARSALIVVEVALTVVLLVCAGLLLRSYGAIGAVDLGFPTGGIVIAQTPLPPSRYENAPQRAAFVEGVLANVERIPGVVSAGFVSFPPLVFKGGRTGFRIEGRPDPPPDRLQIASLRVIGAGYLETLGVPLIRGRLFDRRDGPEASPAALINQAMARTYWGDEDPVGQSLLMDDARLAVVGVVGEVRQMGLEVPAEPEIYLSFSQLPDDAGSFYWPQYLAVRTSGDTGALAPAVRGAVAAVDRDQPVPSVRTMAEVVSADLVDHRTQLTLVGAFAALALILAFVGLYGVLSYGVAQQGPEIGLRMALGAQRTRVVAAVVRRPLVLTGAGLVVGLVCAAGVTRLFRSFLYGVSPTDPVAFAAVAALLAVVAALACWVPARRATRIDPLIAMRVD
jgi:predicted permease